MYLKFGLNFAFVSLLMIEITNCQLATKGKVIENVNVLHKFWELRFAINPRASRAGWTSLVHATAVGNKDIIGARIPGVFFRPGTTILHICGPYIYILILQGVLT